LLFYARDSLLKNMVLTTTAGHKDIFDKARQAALTSLTEVYSRDIIEPDGKQ
jgi:hypothetical protein